MNVITLIGRMVKDPELKQTLGGKSTTTFTLAVQRPSKGKETDFLDVTAWESQAESVVKYCKKGSKLGVTGSLFINSWEKDGKKYTKPVINASAVDFCAEKFASADTEKVEAVNPKYEEVDHLDDLPF